MIPDMINLCSELSLCCYEGECLWPAEMLLLILLYGKELHLALGNQSLVWGSSRFCSTSLYWPCFTMSLTTYRHPGPFPPMTDQTITLLGCFTVKTTQSALSFPPGRRHTYRDLCIMILKVLLSLRRTWNRRTTEGSLLMWRTLKCVERCMIRTKGKVTLYQQILNDFLKSRSWCW